MMLLPIGTQEYPRRRGLPTVTLTLVAVNLAVFVVELMILLGAGSDALDSFMKAFGAVPAAIVSGQGTAIPPYLTLFTSMFVHASIAHVGGNMIFLLPFGDNVEDWLGHLLYLVFYLAAGLVAGIAQVVVDPTSTVPSVGASGAIAGVLGGYLVLFPRGIVRVFLLIWLFVQITFIPALLFIGFWFVLQLFSGVGSLGADTSQTGGVAYWAHVGGFAFGMLGAFLARLLIPQRGSVRA